MVATSWFPSSSSIVCLIQIIRSRYKQFHISTHCHMFSFGVLYGTLGTPMGIIVFVRRSPARPPRDEVFIDFHALRERLAPRPSIASTQRARQSIPIHESTVRTDAHRRRRRRRPARAARGSTRSVATRRRRPVRAVQDDARADRCGEHDDDARSSRRHASRVASSSRPRAHPAREVDDRGAREPSLCLYHLHSGERGPLYETSHSIVSLYTHIVFTNPCIRKTGPPWVSTAGMSRVTVHDSTRSPPVGRGERRDRSRHIVVARASYIVVAKTRSRAESRAESHAKRAVFTLRAIDMNAEECERCLRAIRAHRPDMKHRARARDRLRARVGRGWIRHGVSRAVSRGKVCARVVDSNKESAVVAEVATVSDLPRVAVKTHGCAATTKPSDGKKYLAVVSELCEEGCLEDFMVRERALGRDLSERVRLDVFLQVAEGLEELKAARVVWRDLKAKNVLVRSVVRNSFGTVTKMTIGFTDWGTAVRLPKIGKRRMTLQGPGTCGYIARRRRRAAL